MEDVFDAFAPGGNMPSSLEERDSLCRSFIQERGAVNLLTLIEANFSTVHFYATSATGGAMTAGKQLMPWENLLSPVMDIVKNSDHELYELFRKSGGITE